MAVQGQVIGAPGQATMAAPGDIFMGAQKIYIKQEMAAIELCGIEAKQRYRISIPNGEQEGQVFLYITEESDFCERICCSKQRSLKLKVHQGPTKDHPVIQTMVKPFACGGPCPCLRPTFTVLGPGGDQDMIGTVDDPCKCCVMDQQVKTPQGAEMFTVTGTICQAGLCCPCCFGVNFDTMKNGSKVAGVEKLPLDCADMCLHTNRFMVDFGMLKDPSERKMMLAAAMLLDLEYFEENK